MARYDLMRFEVLSDPGSMAALLPGEPPRAVMIIRRGAGVYGYVNRCPHIGAPLDWQPGQFLSYDRHFIQCSLHNATFRIEDGECIGGPCAGKYLEKVEVFYDEGMIVYDDSKPSG